MSKIEKNVEYNDDNKFDVEIGKKYNFYTILSFDSLDKYSHKKYLCRCQCGVEKVVLLSNLKSNGIKSCGCMKSKLVSDARTTHGMAGTRIYSIWQGMKDRCENKANKDYGRYGGSGVIVCGEWSTSFENFYKWAMENGYKDNLTIDRIDNFKSYQTDNCRWASIQEQAENRTIKSSTGYIGVYKHGDKFQANVTYKNKTTTIGTFDKISDAVTARNKYIIDSDMPHKIQECVIVGEGGNNDNKFDYDLRRGMAAEAELVEIIGGNKLEVKRDFRAHETGNIAVEFECYGKPSGISVSEAEHYAFVCDHITLIIETDKLKTLLASKKFYQVFGGDNNLSHMYLVPMREMIRNV